jgi:hypothetical protein
MQQWIHVADDDVQMHCCRLKVSMWSLLAACGTDYKSLPSGLMPCLKTCKSFIFGHGAGAALAGVKEAFWQVAACSNRAFN